MKRSIETHLRTILIGGIAAIGLLSLSPNSTDDFDRFTIEPPTEISTSFKIESASPLPVGGCKAMVDNYCSLLHSKKAQGNIKLASKTDQFVVIQGQTTNNFDSAEFAFHKARLQGRKRLPTDLRTALENRDFFSSLRVLLSRPPREKMTLQERIAFSDLDTRVDTLWDQALDEVVLTRMDKIHKKFHRLEDQSLTWELDLARWRIRNTLWTEISKAIWSEHERWKMVEREFGFLKKAFIKVVYSLDIPEDLARSWATKIESVQLAIPGYSPIVMNEDCISTARNAFYYPYMNTITVCAGYFNGGEPIQSLAHELAHSIDYSTRLVDYQQSSRFGHKLRELRDHLCQPKKFACGEWASFKTDYDELIDDLGGFEPDLPNFYQCLKKAPTRRLITSSEIDEIAKKTSRRRFSDLAKNNSLFRITKARLVAQSGEVIPNPSHLNPCGYNLWNPEHIMLDSDFTSLLMFTAAYRCSDAPEAQRIRAAVDESKEMATHLSSAILTLEGQYSARESMQEADLASPPNERFADRMGSYIISEYMKERVSNDVKQKAFLASSSWLCNKPSVRGQYLEEFQALSDIIIDRTVHPANEERVKDWLSPPVREVLSCQLDFQHTECDLLKKSDAL